MNSLSLRVSSIKTSENLKKNSEVRMSLLHLPPKYMRSQGQQESSNADVFGANKFKQEFLGATSIDQQLVIIRKSFSTLNTEISTDELTYILQLLADMFFFAPLKHPVRNAISKLLQKAQVLHALIIKCLANTIEEHTDVVVSADNPDRLNVLNTVLTSLGGCFENFPVALTAIKICIQRIFKYIANANVIYTQELFQPLSPAKRSEVFIFIHSSLRLSIAVIQQCFEQTSVDAMEPYLGNIIDTCYVLIGNVDVPMDTKVNCGQFLILGAKLRDTMDVVFEDILYDRWNSNPIQKLVFSVGMINTFEESHLDDNQGYNLLLKITKNLTEIANDNAIEQAKLIAASRGLVHLSKILLLFKLSSSMELKNQVCLKDVLDRCLSFVWTFSEHYLDSVRHLSKDLLKNLLKFTQKGSNQQYQFVIDKVLDVAKCSTNSTIQCLALDHLCQVLGAKPIVKAIPGIHSLIMQRFSDSKWTACYEKLMVSDSLNTDIDEWYLKWIQPTISHFRRSEENGIGLNTYENILSSAITARPDVAELIISGKDNLPIEAYLFVLWTIRKKAIPMKMTLTPALDPIVIDAKFHGVEDVRILPLKILIEIGKSTQVFSVDELNEILAFLYYNCNCQSPSMRSMIGSYMTRAFLRLDASHAVSLRDPTSLTEQNYIHFLRKLRDLCVSNLFKGANFSRRSLSLNMLHPTMRLLEKMQSIEMPSSEIWTKDLYEVLYETVETDTYETNKQLAISIARLFPTDLLKTYHVQITPVNFEEKVENMLTSARPGTSMAGAYLIDYLQMSGRFKSIFDTIIWCERHLLQGLTLARKSVLEAASVNPLYGILYCINRQFGTLDFKEINNEEWRPFITRFIQTCKELVAVVGPIVNSDSPEGYVPTDKMISEDVPDNMGSHHKTTPQMVLLFAWRTVKEVSHFFGHLTLYAPIANTQNSQNGLITVKQVLDIGVHFQIMLAELKHRGAFEQAYVGFSKLCVRLWRSSESELHNCPMVWLVDLIDFISGNEIQSDLNDAAPYSKQLKDLRLCVTRRSAGVPHMIQALITSELQVCSSVGLQYCMRKLFAICRSEGNEVPRTHAFNILRTLFRCTDLSDAIAEYIAEGVECAISGYTAKTWPERNSATLFFSTVIVRIFGVQKTRHSEALNIRNKMTGRIFFLRYPQLFDYILSQLEKATAEIVGEEQQRPTNLHPLLLLLSRLYPSSLEGCETSMQLTDFLPFIMQCCVCPEMETRKLAVKSLLALIPSNNVMDHLAQVLQLIQNSKSNSNAQHGYLLQIYLLIHNLDSSNMTENTEKQLKNLYKDIMHMDIFHRASPNHVLGRVYMDILSDIIIKLDVSQLSVYPESLANELDRILQDCNTDPFNFIGRPEACRSAVILKLLLDIRYNKANAIFGYFEQYVFNGALSRQTQEHIETILNVILLTLGDSKEDLCNELDDEYEFSNFEMDVVALLSNEHRSKICNQLKTNSEFKKELYHMALDKQFYQDHAIKLLTILSKLEVNSTSDNEICDLLKLCPNQPEEYRNALLKLIGAHLRVANNNQMNDNLIDKLFLVLQDAIDSKSIDNLRITAAVCICSIPTSVWDQATLSGLHFLEYTNLLISALQDDHYLAREHATRHIFDLICKPVPRPLPISNRAEELFIDWLDQTFTTKSIANFWLPLLERQLQNENTESEAIEIFNKNEANLFGENQHTAHLIYRKIISKTEYDASIFSLPFYSDRLFFIHNCFE